MADVKATSKLKFRRSRNPGYIPKAADLLEGELFINIADKKLYTKDEEAGTIIGIGGGSGGGGGGELGGGAIIIRPEDAVNSNGNLILSTTKVGEATGTVGLSGLDIKMAQFVPIDGNKLYVDALSLEVGSKVPITDLGNNQWIEIPGKLAVVTSKGESTASASASVGFTTITAKPGAVYRKTGTPVDESTLKLGEGTVAIASKEIVIGNVASYKKSFFSDTVTNSKVTISSPSLNLSGVVRITGAKSITGDDTSTIDVGSLKSKGDTVVVGNLYVEGEIISGAPPEDKPLSNLKGINLDLTGNANIDGYVLAKGNVESRHGYLKGVGSVSISQTAQDASKTVSNFGLHLKNVSTNDWEGNPFYYTEALLVSNNEVHLVTEIPASANTIKKYAKIYTGAIASNGYVSASGFSSIQGVNCYDGYITLNNSGLLLNNAGGIAYGIDFFSNKSVAIRIQNAADGKGLVTDYNASYTKLKDDEFVIGTSIGDGFKGVTINNVKETNAGVTVTPSVGSTTVKLIEANYGNVAPHISTTSNSISIVPTESSKVTFSDSGVSFGSQISAPSIQLGQATVEQTGNILGGTWGVDLKSYINNQITNAHINLEATTIKLPEATIGFDGNITGGVWGTDKTIKEYIDANAGSGGGGGGGRKEAVQVWSGSVTGVANTNPMVITSTTDGDFRCGGKLMLKESSGAWLEYDFDCPDSASPPAGTIQFNRQIFSQNSGTSDMILAQNSMSGTKTSWSLYGHARKTYTEAWWRPY